MTVVGHDIYSNKMCYCSIVSVTEHMRSIQICCYSLQSCSNNTLFSILVVVCDNPYNISGSYRTEPTSHRYQGTVNYTCPQGQRLEDGQDSVEIDCSPMGYWRDWQFYKKCAGTFMC